MLLSFSKYYKMLMIFRKLKYILILFFLFQSLLNAQNYSNLQFEHLTLEDGLSASSVYCILQDSQGFLWFGTADGLNSYDGKKFTVYKNDPLDSNSLSNNTIGTIYEDYYGNLLIGTANGLNHFNPVSETFTRFFNEVDNPNSLPGNDVREIFESENKNIWVRTTKGIARLKIINENNKKINFLKIDTGINSKNLCKFIVDTNEIIWIGTLNGSLHKYDPVNKKTEKYNKFLLSEDMIMTICPDPVKNGKILWFGTNAGYLYKFEIEKNKFTRYFSKDKHKDIKIICAIYPDPNDKNILWLGSWGSGLIRFNTKTEEFQNYRHDLHDAYSIANDFPQKLYFDNTGILWIGVQGAGIDKFDKKKLAFSYNVPALNKLNDKRVNSIYEDFSQKDSLVWIGTFNGGLNKISLTENKVYYYKTDPNLKNSISSNTVWELFNDNQNRLFIGTNNGLSYFDLKTFEAKTINFKNILKTHNIIDIFIDDLDNIWAASYNKGLLKLKELNGEIKLLNIFNYNEENPNSISDNRLSLIYKDIDKILWIGTFNGLNKFNKNDEIFKRYFDDVSNPFSISNNNINSMYERAKDGDSIIWIGTNGGLNKFNKKAEIFTAYTEKDGLPNDVVYAVLGDDKGDLWMSTNKGISKFNPETETFKNYDVNDGLQSNEFNVLSYHLGKSGIMYFGGINGFNAFYPDSIKDNLHIPPVVLTKFSLFNKEVKLDTSINYIKKIVLNYDENFFDFEFAALDYTNPGKNQYAYLLEGVDPEWVEIGNRNTASYTKISPGNYTFSVKASNNDGIWNETGKSIKITIVPPFWQTAWFKGIMIFILFASLFTAYRARIKVIENQKKKLEGLVKIRTNELVEKNQQIMSSIRYAERIQQAIMPVNEQLQKLLPEHFVFFKAKDVVSGDFYWLYKVDGIIFLAAIDCTGHGVPGAFMAMIGNTLLNQIVKENKIYEPDKILENLHIGVRLALKQNEKGSDSRDGMDVCLCRFEPAKNTLTFAGAKRPLYMVQKTEDESKYGFALLEVKGDRKSIGGKQKEEIRTFTNKHVDLFQGDMVYLTTDGFIDQNNPEGKKYGSKKFKQLITSLVELPCFDQKKKINNEFDNHKQQEDQRDDVTIIGFRV